MDNGAAMTPTVSLRAVVDEMDVLSDEDHAYLNIRTGELVTIRNEEIAILENEDAIGGYPDWQQDLIRQTEAVLDSEDCLRLPSKFDIHEYEIMERFCRSVEDEELSNELLYQIRGRGAFRRFNDAIHRHGIAEEWYRFRQAALEAIAIEWLEAHGIPYTASEDTGP
jgi:hypothetical protein